MKAWAKKNAVLLAVLLIGVLAAAGIVAGRAGVERRSRTYDIVMDYTSLKEMEAQSDRDMGFWLDLLKDAGVERVAVKGTTLETLEEDSRGQFQVKTAGDLKDILQWREQLPEAVAALVENSRSDGDLLVITRSSELSRWLADTLDSRAEDLRYKTAEADGYRYLWIENNALSDTDWSQLDLGVWPETAEEILSCGLQVIPRPTPVAGTNGAVFAQAVLAELERYDSPYFINGGDVLPGYDQPEKALERMAEYMDGSGMTVGLVENADQSLVMEWKGQPELLERTDYQAARVFSVWPFIQSQYAAFDYTGPEEITNALYRAAYERGCRIIYLKSIIRKTVDQDTIYITEPKAYTQMITDLTERMERRGYTLDVVRAADYYDVGTPLRMLVGFGAIAALVLLIGMIYPFSGRVKLGMLLVGCMGVAGAMFVMPNTSKLLLSIGGGIVMPCVAVIGLNRYILGTRGAWQMEPLGRNMLRAVGAVLAAYVLSLCGALFACSALSETAYMLETKLYRGVKLMQLVPICVAAFSYLQLFWWEKYIYPELFQVQAAPARERRSLRLRGWNKLMETPILAKHVFEGVLVVLALAVLGAAGVYYLSRTGNASAGISTGELIMRNLLENHLAARPRTKEFLIGTPCLMLMLWSVRRRIPGLPLIFELGAVIGLTSVVNTFLHIRTQFSLSLIRVLTGLGFGLVIGLVCMAAAELLLRLILRIRRRRYV